MTLHFSNNGHPVMIDDGIVTKTILNFYQLEDKEVFGVLIADPHIRQ